MVKGKQKSWALLMISALMLVAGCGQQQTTSPPPANPPSGAGATVQVAISNFTFTPSQVTVKVGDTVVWTNNDSMQHTVVDPLKYTTS